MFFVSAEGVAKVPRMQQGAILSIFPQSLSLTARRNV